MAMSFIRAWWAKLLVVLVAAVLAIQLIPYGVDNPSTNDERATGAAGAAGTVSGHERPGHSPR